jgi:hypothetical protein
MRALVLLATWYACALCARAETPRHALVWTRTPGAEACVDAGALAGAVEARLGRSVFTRTDSSAAVTIDARVSPHWHVAISVHGANGNAIGERMLDEPGANCHALDDALVLVLALIIDPDAATRESPQPREPWRFDAGASLVGAAGVLPGAALGAGVRFGIDPPGLPAFELHASAWLPDETRDGGRGGRFTLVSAGLAVRVPVWRRLETAVGFELARMTGTGIGFDRVQDASAVIPAISVEPRFVIALTRQTSFTAGLALWIPLARPQFTFEQAGMDVVVHELARIAGIAAVSAGLRF